MYKNNSIRMPCFFVNSFDNVDSIILETKELNENMGFCSERIIYICNNTKWIALKF